MMLKAGNAAPHPVWLFVCVSLAACSPVPERQLSTSTAAEIPPSVPTGAPLKPATASSLLGDSLTPTPTSTAGPTPIPPVASLREFDRFTPLIDLSFTIEDEASQLFPDMRYASNVHAYSPDGSLVAIHLADDDGNAHLLIMDAHTTEKVASFSYGDSVNSFLTLAGAGTYLSFTPDGEKLVIGTSPPARVVVWDVSSQEVEWVLLEDDQYFGGPSVAVSPDGKQVAVAYGEHASIFELSSGSLLRQVPGVSNFFFGMPHFDDLPQYSQDGSRLAVYTAPLGSEITVYDTASWSPIQVFKNSYERYSGGYIGGSALTELSPNGRWIASAEWGYRSPVWIFDVDSGEQVAVLEEPLIALPIKGKQVLSGDLVFTPDSSLLLVSGGEPLGEESSVVMRTVGVWDTSTWQRIGSIYSDRKNPLRMFMTSDGLSFSTYYDGQLFIWHPEPPALTEARAALLRFDAALQAGDYASASLEYGASYLVGASSSDVFASNDPAKELETICGMQPDPCPPLRQILLGLYNEEFGACQFFVHFSTPDGALYQDPNGVAAQVIATWCDPSFGLYQVVQTSLFDLAFP